MFTAAELASLRALQNAAMPDTCVVQRLSRDDNDMGESADTYATSSTVACRVAPMSIQNEGDENVIGGKLTAIGMWAITMPDNSDVQQADRITSGGRTFEVRDVQSPQSYETAVRVVAVEVD